VEGLTEREVSWVWNQDGKHRVLRTGLTWKQQTLAVLEGRRRRLLELHYAGNIRAEMFGQQEAELTEEIRALRAAPEPASEPDPAEDPAARFDDVVALLASLDVDRLWHRRPNGNGAPSSRNCSTPSKCTPTV